MKNIFGFDLGSSSIGWAVVNEAQNDSENSTIKAIGVNADFLTDKEPNDFEQGKSISTNADRRLKHGARINLQRYKQRRDNLLKLLRDNNIIDDSTVLTEDGAGTTFETMRLRALAATEPISLAEFARVLLTINKKRGYKSNRKLDVTANSDSEDTCIDGITVAEELFQKGITPGQYTWQLLSQNKKYIPDFYPSDLQQEFDRIFAKQQSFYPELLTEDLRKSLQNKTEKQTWALCAKHLDLTGLKRQTKDLDQKKEEYRWRAEALSQKMDLEQIGVILSKINGKIKSASGYLGSISDHSKQLKINNITVGQYLYSLLKHNPHTRLKDVIFYRQNYIDEFDTIWLTQSHHHPELTDELRDKIRNTVIFYQRPLKSQKGSVNYCSLESKTVKTADGKNKQLTYGLKVSPKSSPLFQEAKIWQIVNNLRISETDSLTPIELTADQKQKLVHELTWRGELTDREALKILERKPSMYSLNYDHIDGNNTNALLLKHFIKVVEQWDCGVNALKGMQAAEKAAWLEDKFRAKGVCTDIFHFDSSKPGQQFEQQPAYQLWHLIYSYESDDSLSGNDTLIKCLCDKFGFDPDSAAIVARCTFAPGYGNLSAKALRKILPHLKHGLTYDKACVEAGYTQQATADYLAKLETMPKGTLRNPVVEKVLNALIHTVNSLIDTYGRPDEIRIELARELKKSAKERKEAYDAINKAKRDNESLRKILTSEFGINNPSRTDIVRLKLYQELKDNKYHTLYSDTYIRVEDLFTKKFDIEHIIPQSRLFDDSFANKTLETREINIDKSNDTAWDYVNRKYGADHAAEYKERVQNLFHKGSISKSKYKNLMTAGSDIPTDFINRELRDTQYISRKALELLSRVSPSVVATTGSITARLREDWQLVDVLKELNWDKYDAAGLTETKYNRDGHQVRRIKDWSKRNDHRHHAMDAITIAFTRREFIQYLNNLNAQSDKSGAIYAIRSQYMERDRNNGLRFKAPIPLQLFRAQAKDQLERLFISFRAKTKVVTANTNTVKAKGGVLKTKQLTPRGELHKDTFYGCIQQHVTDTERIGVSFDAKKIATVANAAERRALMKRLDEFGGDPRKAFTGKNSPAKNPIYLDNAKTVQIKPAVKIVKTATVYTTRKKITPDIKIDKVIDLGIRNILKQRLDEYGNDNVTAFSNLDENPIYLNKEKGITIKRVTLTGPTNVVSLHTKKDHHGMPILDAEGREQYVDFVNTGNNHHVAIYSDAKGNLQEYVVSFFEATSRACHVPPKPIIDKNYHSDEGWKFMFTMKINEYFVFPRYEARIDNNGNSETIKTFDPHDIDLLNPENYALISPNLFRVQKLSSKDYYFRHHLDTSTETTKELQNQTWKRITSLSTLSEAVKVRIDRLGRIVAVGEE